MEDMDVKRDRAQAILENYVKEFKIFVDTCSLLDDYADEFWMNIIPLLKKYGTKIIVPMRSVEELMKHSNNLYNKELAIKSKNTIKLLKQLIDAGFIEVRGEKDDNFADNVFQVVFTKFRLKYKLLLITQDNDLAKDILALNNNRSVKANKVYANRINPYGFLSRFHWDDDYIRQEDSFNNSLTSRIRKVNPDEIFEHCTTVTSLTDDISNVSYIPKEMDNVYTSNGQTVKLTKELATGGEGTIYATNTSYVAKVYKRENNTRLKCEKIKLLLSKPINCEGICAPVTALYNSNNEFVGYLMPQARGKELQKSIFIKPLFLKNFPDWKKRDTVELCITILEKIKYLHDRNIIMGDINPANILVSSPKEVYFVDTDSYQVQNLPCPVGTINYTAPEIQRKHFSSFLRTIGNENFAVATLLFMIMLPGKPPYSQQGGEDPIANIINMDFSYPFGESSNKKTPDGPWRYIWSHLTYDIKKAFYNTFRKGAANSREDTRLSVDEWLPLFRHYLELLDSGKFGNQDKMSETLCPTRHKINANVVYKICKFCGQEVAENLCVDGICRECLNKGEIHYCKKCGKQIIFTNYEKYVKNSKRHDICKDCFEHGNKVKMSLRCSDCNMLFEITNNQYDYYVGKGSLPRRCPSCRTVRKNNTYPPSQNKRFQSETDSSNSGSYCFITTAVCEYLGKTDDCYELTSLRNYRDTWLINQPDGEMLIKEYYAKAPLLVSMLKTSERYEEYCEILLLEYIRPCLAMIEKGLFDECKKKYISMEKYLESEFKTEV